MNVLGELPSKQSDVLGELPSKQSDVLCRVLARVMFS